MTEGGRTVLILFVTAAAASDLRWGRIYNFLTLPTLAAGLLLRHALKDAADIDLKTAEVTQNQYGKPILADTEIHFNLSHSGERVICALSDRPIGADIQRVEAEPRLKLARRFFQPDEVAYIRSWPDLAQQAAAFCRLWALKESALKFTGLGLRLPLDEFEIQIGEKPALRCGKFAERLQFWEEATPEYQIALCSAKPFDGLERIVLRRVGGEAVCF